MVWFPKSNTVMILSNYTAIARQVENQHSGVISWKSCSEAASETNKIWKTELKNIFPTKYRR